MKEALELIRLEREKQTSEGYDAEHDDRHQDGSLTTAALLVLHGCVRDYMEAGGWVERLAVKMRREGEKDPIRPLVVAAALLAAEINRLLRLSAPKVGERVRILLDTMKTKYFGVFEIRRPPYGLGLPSPIQPEYLEGCGQVLRGIDFPSSGVVIEPFVFLRKVPGNFFVRLDGGKVVYLEDYHFEVLRNEEAEKPKIGGVVPTDGRPDEGSVR